MPSTSVDSVAYVAVAAKSGERESIVARHHPVGASTGYMNELREDWPSQVAAARAVSPFAIELSALSEKQLAGLHAFLAARPSLPFRYLTIHGPSKDRAMSEKDLVSALHDLSRWSDGIVMHPDTMESVHRYLPLGRKLLIENMDSRKEWGRTADELAPVFQELPEAGFCFDIPHAWSINADMSVANELLNVLGDRLRHIHLSSLSPELHHVSLTADDEELFRPVLERCVDVPWILEAPPRAN